MSERKQRRKRAVKEQEEAQTTLFDELSEEFHENGLSQESLSHLSILSSSAKPRHLQEMLFVKLAKNAREMLMTELEIIIWSVYIENIGWPSILENTDANLTYSAYAVKQELNKDISPVTDSLISDNPAFPEDFRSWLTRHKSSLSCTPKALNKKFRRKKTPSANNEADYNAYVDEILCTMPSKLTATDSLKNDPEIVNVYKAYRNKKIILLKSELSEEVPPEAFEKLDSIIGEIDVKLENNDPVAYVNPKVMDRINTVCSEIFSSSLDLSSIF